MGKRELSIGSLVHNRYRVEKVLGQGGFGITYRVMDLKDGCTAAMKEYMPLDIAFRPLGRREVRPTSQSKQNQYEKFKQYFLQEAHTIYQFRGHPNIVEVRHLFSENNTAYYVMEYIEGMDLGNYLKKQGGFLDWAALRPIAAQVVSALQQVHKANIIHCDITLPLSSTRNEAVWDPGQMCTPCAPPFATASPGRFLRMLRSGCWVMRILT